MLARIVGVLVPENGYKKTICQRSAFANEESYTTGRACSFERSFGDFLPDICHN